MLEERTGPKLYILDSDLVWYSINTYLWIEICILFVGKFIALNLLNSTY